MASSLNVGNLAKMVFDLTVIECRKSQDEQSVTVTDIYRSLRRGTMKEVHPSIDRALAWIGGIQSSQKE